MVASRVMTHVAGYVAEHGVWLGSWLRDCW